ncbi:MAG TPA: response regulator [Marinagarivorans sp.]
MLTSPIKWDANGKPVLILIVAPIFLICALCVATFVVLHNNHRAELNRASHVFFGKYFEQQLAQLSGGAPSVEWFETHASAALHTGLYEHLALLDSNRQPIAHAGLPTSVSDYRWLSAKDLTQFKKRKRTYLAYPGTAPNGKTYWLVAAINNSPSRLLFFQTLLWGLACTFIAAVVIAWLAIRCHKQLITPITRLTQELKQGINENFDITLTTPRNNLYANLIQVVQQLLDMNKGLKEGTQQYIEQATQELRESLETVEIQNIELDIARKNALQASADKSELLATTSHEIRTPLNGILGFTNLLIKTELSDQQKDYLATIEQSAQGLLTVINDVIDFSRLESGTMTFEYKPVKIRAMVAEILQVYAPSANESHLRLIQLIDPSIPPTLLGDPLRLKQVLNNLIHCLVAIESSGDLIVECATQHKADSKIGLQFSLKNPTAQLTRSQQAQLKQAITSQGSLPVSDATGLGLTIARALAERMHGNIAVDFNTEGVTFFFRIELGQTETQLDPTRSIDTSGIRAVVCDNNPYSRQEIVIDLKAWDISPTIESNPDKLVRAISNARANLVILDFATDGRRFNKTRLENYLNELYAIPQLHVAVIAPSNIRRQIEKSGQWHDAHFITRPITQDAIVQLLRRISGSPDDVETLFENQELKILVADDNPANTKLVCAFLQQKNHAIHAVANGRLAVDAFIESTPDIIFMDVQMPEMDGLQATLAIREYELQHQLNRVPIVALTANALPEQRAKILMSGMDDYLTKPVSDHDLKHALHRWVDPFSASQKSKAASTLQNQEPSVSLPPDETKLPETTAAPTNNAPSESTFSLQANLELTKGNHALAKEMYEMLLKDLAVFRKSIAAALAEHDVHTLSATIHKLRGGLSYSGFIKLSKQCALTDNQLTTQGELSPVVRSEIAQLLSDLDDALQFAEQMDAAVLFEDDGRP